MDHAAHPPPTHQPHPAMAASFVSSEGGGSYYRPLGEAAPSSPPQIYSGPGAVPEQSGGMNYSHHHLRGAGEHAPPLSSSSSANGNYSSYAYYKQLYQRNKQLDGSSAEGSRMSMSRGGTPWPFETLSHTSHSHTYGGHDDHRYRGTITTRTHMDYNVRDGACTIDCPVPYVLCGGFGTLHEEHCPIPYGCGGVLEDFRGTLRGDPSRLSRAPGCPCRDFSPCCPFAGGGPLSRGGESTGHSPSDSLAYTDSTGQSVRRGAKERGLKETLKKRETNRQYDPLQAYR